MFSKDIFHAHGIVADHADGRMTYHANGPFIEMRVVRHHTGALLPPLLLCVGAKQSAQLPAPPLLPLPAWTSLTLAELGPNLLHKVLGRFVLHSYFFFK